MRFDTNLYEERQYWIQNVQLREQSSAEAIWAAYEASRPAREAARAQQAAALRAANIAAQKKAAAWAAGRTALKGAGVVGAAIGAADLGYMAGNAIGNTDIVQNAAGGVGEWWANTMPSWLGGVDNHGLPPAP